ncbi:N-acetylglutamate synthase-like GNAT family acetyltransferase [Dysgonomonas alginatilytica]|uniref:N-acetylglutamate synthase-like GNAT family acetyltransferase n=1 Tax=Dysgonomonas alginatilytica TaxID=1605892 RepID=A0A2V3PTZ3_9BACT|nr:GNAT family N-acetyltransferase [Dysgonomonas alginatilytica]PXV69177.1 N-acetylglutamate synthase-like GNAT family acetyltransferase [Dysgonomonas alginatilytica]
MPIRKAELKDSQAIRDMLDQLGYPLTNEFIKGKLMLLLNSSADEIYVYEDNNKVVGFLTLHFTVQLAFEHNFCEIGYFVVDKNVRSKGVGKQLEEMACKVALDKDCDRIEVFSLDHRTDAHRFYERQGYSHIQKKFEKILDK